LVIATSRDALRLYRDADLFTSTRTRHIILVAIVDGVIIVLSYVYGLKLNIVVPVRKASVLLAQVD
jgi:hypothetical protein